MRRRLLNVDRKKKPAYFLFFSYPFCFKHQGKYRKLPQNVNNELMPLAKKKPKKPTTQFQKTEFSFSLFYFSSLSGKLDR